jgi:hypothetical protein
MLDFGRNWPIYFLIGLTVFFFVFIAYKSKQEEKRKRYGRKNGS